MGNVGSVSRSIIQRIHSNGADINSEVADNGATLLHLATVLEDKQAIKDLLDNGASVNVPDKSGQLPLHLSLSTSNAECAEILLEAHIKEETEKLQESLRKSSELANNQLHCLQTDLDSNNNTNRENVNMNLSVQPSHDSEELFEPYHSTNSVSDSIMQRNETEHESDDDLDKIPDMDDYSTRDQSIMDESIYDTENLPEIVIDKPAGHPTSEAMPIKGNSSAAEMAMSGSLKLDDFTVLSVSNSLTDPSQLEQAMKQDSLPSLEMTRVNDNVDQSMTCDTPNTGRVRRFQSWVASFFHAQQGIRDAFNSTNPPTVAHTIQLAAELELMRSKLGELQQVQGDLQQMRALLDQYKSVMASLTVEGVLAHSIQHSPPRHSPIAHYLPPPVPLPVVEDVTDTSNAVAPPPPPPPPGPGAAPPRAAKPKGPQPLTPEQLCKAVTELIAQGDVEAANVAKVAANYNKVMFGEGEDGLKNLAKLVQCYPRVIQGAPLKPKSAGKAVALYESGLISRLEQDGGYTQREIDDVRRAKQTMIVKTVKELKDWAMIEDKIKQDIADTFKTLEWKKKQKQLEEEQKKNKNLLTSVIDELASIHKMKETESAAVRAQQELLDMETD
jgi:hypothetical protein